MFIPDLYLSWKTQPTPKTEYSFKFEAVGTFGELSHVPLASFAAQDALACEDPSLPVEQCPESLRYQPRERSINAWGYALEFDAKKMEMFVMAYTMVERLATINRDSLVVAIICHKAL